MSDDKTSQRPGQRGLRQLAPQRRRAGRSWHHTCASGAAATAQPHLQRYRAPIPQLGKTRQALPPGNSRAFVREARQQHQSQIDVTAYRLVGEYAFDGIQDQLSSICIIIVGRRIPREVDKGVHRGGPDDLCESTGGQLG